MYDTLFSEIQIGSHTIQNRVAFCGPVTGFANDGQPTTQLAAYYLERAKGGAGLMELEPALVFNKHSIGIWREFAEQIHAYGTKLAATFEILHDYISKEAEAVDRVITESVELIRAARFDGVTLSLKKTLRDGKETGQAGIRVKKLLHVISKKCGEYFFKGVHLHLNGSGSDKATAKDLQDAGADYLVLPCADGYDESGVSIPVAKKVRFSGPESCEELLLNGGGDLVALSGQLVCDPFWPVKAELGKEKEIRKHDYCKEDNAIPEGRISCMLNPYLGQESRYGENNMTPAARVRNVVVVGGGPAGMQAAITASQRGHSVLLLEKEDELGGRLRTQNMSEAAEWFVEEMKRNQVDVRLGLPVTTEHIAALKPEIVIIAAGDHPSRKKLVSSLRKKRIQVVDINDDNYSIGQAIRSGFHVAIGI